MPTYQLHQLVAPHDPTPSREFTLDKFIEFVISAIDLIALVKCNR